MTPAGLLLSDPPLDPSGDEARSWLRQELLHPEYHQQNVVERLLIMSDRDVIEAADVRQVVRPAEGRAPIPAAEAAFGEVFRRN